ncbi:putative T7SS-secreted protein [Curtobacterium flaccumfaciens]|uniref:putative T7SS-secreted protein n=1 Tax=Curtobacterium flaccumfaciens TaxID=2035 RepID=UPI00217EFA69|nr:polymorphic toxin type 15 domain-containing protein [Curtobacterium flaccumfaciens]MCS6587487.1 polymorphic toxin type 15 domain-containing protein [Curtobacterium flaccumfaciens pv. flaccumfaciens]
MDNGARDRTWGGMMGRPSGWDVVDQGDDPVKGDPSTLRMMAREYQRISDAADDASTRLQSVKGSGWLTDWEGEAADVFVDAIEDTPSDLSKLVDSYELAATALSGWADSVDDTQYRADGALADAKDATGDLAAAQDRLADAQSTLSHYESASKDLSKVADEYPAGSDVPDGVDVPSPAQLRAASDNASVAQGSVSSAQGDISAAQSRIDAAKRLVADAKGDWQDAEQRTATKIGEAADAGLGKQSTWDKIFGSEAWETIVSVAKVVVAVGGIIAMIIPGPWTLVIAAIALVVLADTLYKMSKGEADGWDLAFSLLDCVPGAGVLGRAAGIARSVSKAASAERLVGTAANGAANLRNGSEVVAGITKVVVDGRRSAVQGVEMTLKYKKTWGAGRRAAADQKVAQLDDLARKGELRYTEVSEADRKFRVRDALKKHTGLDPKGMDADHVQDLQLGGQNIVSNFQWLDRSVNRSIGSQVRHEVERLQLDPGDLVHRVTISMRK